MKCINLLAVAVLIAAVACVSAQTAPTPAAPAGFVASSDALGINCNGWGAGNITKEALDLVDVGPAKSNRIFIEGIELTAPPCGFSIFGGGAIFQPDISALLNRTNIPSGNVLLSMDASVGNALETAGPNHVAFEGGVKLQYIINDGVTLNAIQAGVVNVGGHWYPMVSAGLSGYFGGTPASAAQSSNVLHALQRKMAKLALAIKAQQ
jgi:hypothetical protein